MFTLYGPCDVITAQGLQISAYNMVSVHQLVQVVTVYICLSVFLTSLVYNIFLYNILCNVHSDTVESETLVRNIKVISEAVARHVFNMSAQTSSEVFTSGLVCIQPACAMYITTGLGRAMLLASFHG